jgi:hypothetical protein
VGEAERRAAAELERMMGDNLPRRFAELDRRLQDLQRNVITLMKVGEPVVRWQRWELSKTTNSFELSGRAVGQIERKDHFLITFFNPVQEVLPHEQVTVLTPLELNQLMVPVFWSFGSKGKEVEKGRGVIGAIVGGIIFWGNGEIWVRESS